MTSHPIPAAALKESMALSGHTGSGKTYAAKSAVEILLARCERVCIIDPTGVWYGPGSSANGEVVQTNPSHQSSSLTGLLAGLIPKETSECSLESIELWACALLSTGQFARRPTVRANIFD